MIFEPLNYKRRGVILSTDIAGDCDDVGALALLYSYADELAFPVLGICNCTTNRDGTNTVYAVNKYLSHEKVALGEYTEHTLPHRAEASRYTGEIAERFGKGAPKPVPSTEFYRKLLSEAEDDGVIIITIGFFTDLAALLLSDGDGYSPLSGVELVKKKVHAVVSMATRYPRGLEFNVRLAPKEARTFFERCPVDIYLSDFDLGADIYTGFEFAEYGKPAIDPIRESYRLHTAKYKMPGFNSSFDQTAVHFAIVGEGEFYKIAERGRINFYRDDKNNEVPDTDNATEFINDTEGRVYLLKKACDKELIRAAIQERMMR